MAVVKMAQSRDTSTLKQQTNWALVQAASPWINEYNEYIESAFPEFEMNPKS